MNASVSAETHRGRHPWLGAALVLCAASLWATFGLFAKSLYAFGFTPAELASVRSWLGFAGVAVIALRRPRQLRLSARDLAFFAVYGTAGFALFVWLYFETVERTTIAVAAALLYTAPAFVVLLSRVLWHERVGATRMLALVLVIAGVLLVTGALGAILTGTVDVRPAAIALGLGAGFTYALYTVFSKLALDRTTTVPALFWSFAFASLALAVLAPPIEPLTRDISALPRLLALGLVPTLLAYSLYLRALPELQASTASMLASVEPAVATILGAIFFAERVSPAQLAGIALIVLAAVLIARSADRRT